MKTYTHKGDYTDRQWYVVDASNLVLGRLASRVATILRGKHKPVYSPHLDVGDFVVVINADKIRLTGGKAGQKVYQRYTGYPGGLKTKTFVEMQEKFPERVIEIAVRGMLPKNTLGRKQLKKMKVYRGAEHPHTAQNPKTLDISTTTMAH